MAARKRKRDFFRLNKQDQLDLQAVLNRNLSFERGVRSNEDFRVSENERDIKAFNRLFVKFFNRLGGFRG